MPRYYNIYDTLVVKQSRVCCVCEHHGHPTVNELGHWLLYICMDCMRTKAGRKIFNQQRIVCSCVIAEFDIRRHSIFDETLTCTDVQRINERSLNLFKEKVTAEKRVLNENIANSRSSKPNVAAALQSTSYAERPPSVNQSSTVRKRRFEADDNHNSFAKHHKVNECDDDVKYITTTTTTTRTTAKSATTTTTSTSSEKPINIREPLHPNVQLYVDQKTQERLNRVRQEALETNTNPSVDDFESDLGCIFDLNFIENHFVRDKARDDFEKADEKRNQLIKELREAFSIEDKAKEAYDASVEAAHKQQQQESDDEDSCVIFKLKPTGDFKLSQEWATAKQQRIKINEQLDHLFKPYKIAKSEYDLIEGTYEREREKFVRSQIKKYWPLNGIF
jgi:hypothetical protein